MERTLRVGLLGCGVVGGGVVEALAQNGDVIAARSGIRFEIRKIAVRHLDRPRGPHVQHEWLCTDWQDVCCNDEVDIVVEAMGGLSPAGEAIETALALGKPVVTANKELLAKRVGHLVKHAHQHQQPLLFEASVLGGVPVLHALQTYFAANRLRGLRGIVNGTCNFVLDRMTADGLSFAEALLEAQAAGYAEADPSMDIEGKDAFSKLRILSWFGLGAELPADGVSCVGIDGVTPEDISLARALECKVKLIAEARLDAANNTVLARVGPAFVPDGSLFYSTNGAQNALCISADIVGDVWLCGPGAGSFPTASAVVEDLLKVAQGITAPCIEAQSLQVASVGAPAYALRFRNASQAARADVEVSHSNLSADLCSVAGLGSVGTVSRVLVSNNNKDIEWVAIQKWLAGMGLSDADVQSLPFIQRPTNLTALELVKVTV